MKKRLHEIYDFKKHLDVGNKPEGEFNEYNQVKEYPQEAHRQLKAFLRKDHSEYKSDDNEKTLTPVPDEFIKKHNLKVLMPHELDSHEGIKDAVRQLDILHASPHTKEISNHYNLTPMTSEEEERITKRPSVTTLPLPKITDEQLAHFKSIASGIPEPEHPGHEIYRGTNPTERAHVFERFPDAFRPKVDTLEQFQGNYDPHNWVDHTLNIVNNLKADKPKRLNALKAIELHQTELHKLKNSIGESTLEENTFEQLRVAADAIKKHSPDMASAMRLGNHKIAADHYNSLDHETKKHVSGILNSYSSANSTFNTNSDLHKVIGISPPKKEPDLVPGTRDHFLKHAHVWLDHKLENKSIDHLDSFNELVKIAAKGKHENAINDLSNVLLGKGLKPKEELHSEVDKIGNEHFPKFHEGQKVTINSDVNHMYKGKTGTIINTRHVRSANPSYVKWHHDVQVEHGASVFAEHELHPHSEIKEETLEESRWRKPKIPEASLGGRKTRLRKARKPTGRMEGKRTFRSGAGLVVTQYDITYPFRRNGYTTTVVPGGQHRGRSKGISSRNPMRPGFKHAKISRGASHMKESMTESETNEKIRSLIDNAWNSKPAEVQTIFDDLIKARLADAVEARKQELAQNYMNRNFEETETDDETDETQDDSEEIDDVSDDNIETDNIEKT